MNIPSRVGYALKELGVGNVGNALSILGSGQILTVDNVLSNSYRGLTNNSGFFFAPNGVDYHFDFSGYNSCWDGYEKCPPLAAVINRKTQAYLNGKMLITNTNGQAIGKESSNPIAVKIRNLMNRPNHMQSGKEFKAQNYAYKEIFGYCPIYVTKPVGFPNYDATEMWNIPPHLLEITESNKIFFLSDGQSLLSNVVFQDKGQRVPLMIDNLFFIKDFTYSRKSVLLPTSRMQALEMPINNIIGAYETRSQLINERGAQGILSQKRDPDGNMPFTQADKAAIHEGLMGYGQRRNQKKIIVTNADLSWQEMGYPTKDLMLFEEIQDDIDRICDSYGYPKKLLSNEKSGSFSGTDADSFNKQLYSNTIIPEADNLAEQWNHFFEIEGLPFEITTDFNHMEVLQEDKKLAAEVRFNISRSCQMDFLMNVINLGQYRLAIGEETNGVNDELYYSDIKDLIGTPKVTQGEMSEQEAPPPPKK